jgi:hypothetical protein
MKAQEGDVVTLQAPGGATQLTVLEITYATIDVEPFREPLGSETKPRRP